MDTKVIVSIIIPVYNTEKYIEKCILSVLKQKFQDFEVLLIDDGSTDSSGKICDKYIEHDERISVVHQTNQGLSAARNVGIKRAKGKYICFIDSDDIIAEDYLSILYENALYFNADVVWCKFQRFYTEDELGQLDLTERVGKVQEKRELWYKLSTTGPTSQGVEIVIACNKLIRSSLCKNLQFPIGKWHEDEFFVNDLLKYAGLCVEVNIPLYYYRQRSDSIVGKDNQFDNRHLHTLEALRQRIKICKEVADPDIYEEMIKAYRQMIIIYYSVLKKKSWKVYLKFQFFFSYLRYFLHGTDLRWKSNFLFFFNANKYYEKYWS